jgi:hypothetical protein
MPVTVVNIREWKGNATYIGRSTDPKFAPFGNPFSHKDGTLAKYKVATREESIERYKTWIWDHWEEDEYFRLCLTALVRDHLEGKEIVLGCFCKPLPCHGDVLKEAIEGLAELGVVQAE